MSKDIAEQIFFSTLTCTEFKCHKKLSLVWTINTLTK